ncbi:hypothetical protein BV898_19790 [Hypsibius exemplaris]|uniref:Ubiquitin-like protease family profile domain-containing protein n=1 Tax=Hypsibius exemplaris TaxID=2072580 RepID=A0A9X6NSS6_HYPEX|nr:hypothetical protein BV898_19790 [Hypsibius exemplaris]
MSDEGRKITGTVAVVHVEDPAQHQKALQQAITEKIQCTLQLFGRLFAGDGPDAIATAWRSSGTASPKFPYLPGVIKAAHVVPLDKTASIENLESLYADLKTTHRHALACIAAEAWLVLAKQLNHPAKNEVTVDDGVSQHVTWVYHGRNLLSLSAKMSLETTAWIDDEVVNTAMSVLSLQFPDVAGFRSSLFFNLPADIGSLDANGYKAALHQFRSSKMGWDLVFTNRLSAAANRQIQLLFVNGNHWITVSNIHGLTQNEVLIYDSLPSVYDHNFALQVASVFRMEADEMKLIFPPMGRQPNFNDCGAFAVAAAVALAFKERPEAGNFEPRSVRQHLIECLGNRRFSLIPSGLNLLAEIAEAICDTPAF